jgi:dihydroorotase
MTNAQLEITKPDDWHIHLRDGAYLQRTVPDAARQFRRVIVMPNLTPAIDSLEAASAYRQRICQQIPANGSLQPLMTLYLTPGLSPGILRTGKEQGLIHAVKLYPAGATTNSAAGVSDLRSVYPVLEEMQAIDLPLLVHGEVTDADVDIFDREQVFIERHLSRIVADFPNLRVVLEHITTKQAVTFVEQSSARIAATITPQHLLYNRNALLAGGIRPHFYCLPILKRDTHQKALQQAAISGNPKFFLGTDSAPHSVARKQSHCGCAGCYSARSAIELYCEAFEQLDALPRLEAFASHFGADFYRLPRNRDSIRLHRQRWTLEETLDFGGEPLRPLKAGESLNWKLQDETD